MSSLLVGKLGLPELWLGEISDDLSLTCRTKEMGVEIFSIIRPLVRSQQFVCSYQELYQWALRQFSLERCYLPSSYWATIAIAGASFAWVLLEGMLLFYGPTVWVGMLIVVQGMSLFATMRWLGMMIRFDHLLSALIVTPFFVFSVALRALSEEEIEWKGARYKLWRTR